MSDGPGGYDHWVGRSETATDTVTATPYAALAATLDRDCARPSAGTPLPPLWHWLYFLPLYRNSDAGPDGHARRGEFLPPVPLPRRMWAGSDFKFRRALAVGDRLTRTSTIVSVTEKTGRTGPLVFVRVRHEIRRGDNGDDDGDGGGDGISDGDGEPALVEHHDIVYRAAAEPGDAAAAPQLAPATSTWEKRWVPSDLLLFRYSALTFNGHRIHYDRRYATEVEGYPGLVVHGPLVATLLLDLLRHERPDADVATYRFRAVRPLFDLDPFYVCGEPAGDGRSVRLWARDHAGCLAMEASATLR